MPWVPSDEFNAPLSLTLGVRPARGLVLVPNIDGISWMRTFEAAIASQMRCWGGGQNLIVPFDDKIGDNPLFWHLIDRLDPDQIRVYTGSMADLEELDPEEYRTAREAQQAEMADLPGNHEPFWDAWRRLQLVECDIPVDLRTEVNRRIAPLQLAGFEEWMWTNGATEPLEPFTDVTHFVNLPGRVTEVGRANLSEVERLLLTVEVGRLPPGMRENLVARGFDMVVQELAGSGPARMMIFRRQPSEDVYPLAVSESGLGWYRSGHIRPFPVPIVVGDDPWDFALFYALRRWRSVAYWVPESLLEDEGFCRNVMSAVEFRQPVAAYGATVVSASSEELATSASERLRAWHQRILAGRRPRVELTTSGWANVIPGPPNRLYELDSFDRPYALYLH
jgi:hypothetical protein